MKLRRLNVLRTLPSKLINPKRAVSDLQSPLDDLLVVLSSAAECVGVHQTAKGVTTLRGNKA